MSRQIWQDGADLIGEQVLGVQKVLKQHGDNFDIFHQNLRDTQQPANARYMFVLEKEIKWTHKVFKGCARVHYLMKSLIGWQVDKDVVAVLHYGNGRVRGQVKQGSN